MKRTAIGTAAALASMAVLTAAMLPIRASLSIAGGAPTIALVLVVPVVIGVVVGGFAAGVISVTFGFLVYDFFFIPPYLTLWVGRPQNWAALAVYVAVMLPVARVVAAMNAARGRERRQATELRELFQLSGLLLADKPVDDLLTAVVTTVAEVFGARQVAVLLPRDGRLQLAATAGEPLTSEQLALVLPPPGSLARVGAPQQVSDDLIVHALAAAGRPVGLLVLAPGATSGPDQGPLSLFANQVALAVERAQLREQVLQARLMAEVARLSRTLVAAVSHDLRAPLTRLKASSSTLADDEFEISPSASRSLARLIDAEADRLADLVQNLLDMSRIQAGVLQPRRALTAVADLVTAVLIDVHASLRGHQVELAVDHELPPIDVDITLISRVLTNIMDNAVRHAPRGTPITVGAAAMPPGRIVISVADQGPGISPERRDEVFGLLARRDDDAGAGLGLSIAKTFVEAHGERIWVEDAPGGGARFCFTVPVAEYVEEDVPVGAAAHR
jgi:two-component system, OmpR family, sensor histidine kinase KdpD